jgi:glyoxylase-like metal-dependent hydrolase (beta-lactamase superfamily II)
MSAASHRFMVGEIECTAIADGTLDYAADALFANAPKERVEEVVREHELQPQEIPLSFTGLVINTGRQRVLVDTGLGAGVVPSAGRLLENLRVEGIGPEDIDTVILTHGHPDHIGGYADAEGNLAFPKARYVMWKDDWDFWTSESTLGKLDTGQLYGVPELDAMIGAFARQNLPPIQDQIDVIERETEIVAEVHAIPAPGHTPGHMALLISSGDEQALHLADTVLHPIHLERPEWYPLYDLQQEQAASTRRKLLDRAAAENALVLSYHFPFPSLGYLSQKNKGWEWEPIEC